MDITNAHPDIICTACQTPTNWLAIFPGDLCLSCFEKTPEARRAITAEELTAMWGG